MPAVHPPRAHQSDLKVQLAEAFNASQACLSSQATRARDGQWTVVLQLHLKRPWFDLGLDAFCQQNLPFRY